MSRSPRKLLLRATDALSDFDAVLERYAEAEAQVRAALGDEGLAEVRRVRTTLMRAAERLSSAPEQSAPSVSESNRERNRRELGSKLGDP